MKKSVRITILVITIVVTLFVCAGIWYTRPGVPNDLLDQAKQRQLKPLLEIAEPIRLTEVPQAESVTAHVDTAALAEKMLPSLIDSVKQGLLNDQQLLQDLSARLEPLFTSRLEAALAAKLPTMSQAIDTTSLLASVKADFDQREQQLRSEAEAMKASLGSQMNERLDQYKNELTASMEAYVPQLVDRMIPQVVQEVLSELDTNKEAYLAYLAEGLKPYFPSGIQESQLLDLYNSYRKDLLSDLVPPLLTSLEEPMTVLVKDYVEELTAIPVPAKPKMKKPMISVMVEEEPPMIAEEAAPAPALEGTELETATSAPVVETAVVEEKALEAAKVEETVLSPTPAEVPAVPVIKSGQPVITVPVFDVTTPEVFLDPVVYEQQRQDLRTQAIQAILDRIGVTL